MSEQEKEKASRLLLALSRYVYKLMGYCNLDEELHGNICDTTDEAEAFAKELTK